MKIKEITLKAHMCRGGSTSISGYCIDDDNIIRDISAFKMFIFSTNEMSRVMDDLAYDICESYKTGFFVCDTKEYRDLCGDFYRRYYL